MKSKVDQKLSEFFASHPDATVVFVALGVLFTELDKAEAFCGGTAGKAITYTREQVEALDDEAAGVIVDDVDVDEVEKVEEVETPEVEETPAPEVEETPAPEVEETPAPTRRRRRN